MNGPWLDPKPVSREGWHDGPWSTETDGKWWEGADGAVCWVARSNVGTLCGYVIVPPGHPWHLLHKSCVPGDVNADWGQHADGLTWFGFDCNHDWNYGPRSEDHGSGFRRYVTIREARRMVEELAAALTTPPEDRAAAVAETRRALEREAGWGSWMATAAKAWIAALDEVSV